MPISTVCTDCRKTYTVKEEMAGKRFRCKECQSIVTVPGASAESNEDDPFSGADLQSTGEAIRNRRRDDEDGGEDENPYSSPKAKSKPARKKKARGPSIPLIAIAAIVLQCLLTLYPVLWLIIVAAERELVSRGEIVAIMMIRLAIAISVLVGLIRRKQNARQWSRGLCIFGLIVCGIIAALILGLGDLSDDTISNSIDFVVQWVVWLALLICLSTESAADWFNE